MPEGVDIEISSDAKGYPYNVGWIETDEWLKFTLNALKTDNYNVKLRIASASNTGIIQLVVNDQLVNQKHNIPNTGGWQEWETLDIGNILLSKGSNSLVIRVINGGFNFNQMEFTATGSVVFMLCNPNDTDGRKAGLAWSGS